MTGEEADGQGNPGKVPPGGISFQGASISNPDKPLWPDVDPPVTKGYLARYYEKEGTQ